MVCNKTIRYSLYCCSPGKGDHVFVASSSASSRAPPAAPSGRPSWNPSSMSRLPPTLRLSTTPPSCPTRPTPTTKG